MSWLKKIFRSGMLLVLILLLFIFATETGVRFVIQGICKLIGPTLVIEQVEGRLIDSLQLKNVRLTLPSAVTSIDKIDWNWQPSALLNGQTRIAALYISRVRTVLSGKEAEKTDDKWNLPSIYFPVMLVIEEFALFDLRIANSENQVVFVLDSLQFRLEARGNNLLLNDFELQSPLANVSLHGRIETVRGWQADILGNWNFTGFGFHRMDGTFSTTGPVVEPQIQIGVHSPGAIRIKGQLFNLLDHPQWSAKLEAAGVDLSALIWHCPQIELANVEADMKGDFSSYGGKVTASGKWQNISKLNLISEIQGDGRGINFDLLRINRPDGYAQAWDGKISWAEIFDWQGRFHFENFDLRTIDKRLQGEVTADLESVGKVLDKGVHSSFDIQSLKGEMNDQKFAAEGKIVLDGSSVFTDGLFLKSEGITGEAHIKNARFSWDGLYDWNFQMQLNQFNPGFIHPFVSGNISGEINGGGNFPESGPEAEVEFASLSGVLRDKEVLGTGKISYTAGSFKSPGLKLIIGDSVLAVDGKAEKDLALDFTFDSPDLTELIPFIHGEVSLQGSLHGSRDKPQLEVELKGKELIIGQQNLRSLETQFRGELSKNGRVAGQAEIEGLYLGSNVVDGNVSFDGSLTNQQIEANFSTDNTGLEVEATLVSGNNLQGTVDRFSVTSKDYGNWKLREQVDFFYETGGGTLSSFCLTAQRQQVCMTAQASLAETVNWEGQVSWRSIPMSFVYGAGMPAIPLAGLFEGEFNFSGQSQFINYASLQAAVLNPIIQFERSEDEVVVIPLQVAALESELTDEKMHTRLLLSSPDTGKLEFLATLTGISELGLPLSSYLDIPLQGSLIVDQFNSEVFSSVSDFLIEPEGPIDSDLSIEGTIRKPELYGTLSLEQGSVTIPSQGVTLENVNVSLLARDNGARLHCRASSGQGTIVANGNITQERDGIEGEVKITGEDFLLVNLPEYVFRVSPEVEFTFSKAEGEMKGRIKVPYGLITPEEMTNSIKVSPDVVFVEGQEEIREKGWPFYLDLNVEIGDDVRVDGYGLTGKLGGKMNVKISPDDFITGIGELQLLEGIFTIYGRSLDIERGLVKFTGGPIDNPGIDVRAQKTVSDKKAKNIGYTVGVDISGLTQDLKFQLFSDPVMDETEILSQMIVGHSLAGSSESEGSLLQAAAKTLGITGGSSLLKDLGNLIQLDDLHLEGSEKNEDVSLVVGKSLTKDLYIGYDINLFSELGQFRVRYDLTRGFWVETKSSSESTGADLLYTFER